MDTTGYLQKAMEISGSTGARGNTYGTAESNFTRIAALWNAQLGERLTSPLQVEDVAILMLLLKTSRLANSPTHMDSWIDIAGYVNCVSTIHHGE